MQAKTRLMDTRCDWALPINVSTLDVLADATAQATLAHDEAGTTLWMGAHQPATKNGPVESDPAVTYPRDTA